MPNGSAYCTHFATLYYTTVKISVPKETKDGERRVALTPDTVRQLTKAGFNCQIEAGAGAASFFADSAYQQAGATVFASAAELLANTQVLLKVNAPTPHEINALPPQQAVCISLLYAHTQAQLVQLLCDRGVSAVAMDAVPRITKAQKMDALSSQANLAGYKAVLLGANMLGKIFPLMMTAAGTITPVRVLIFGAGVAGLQALATARRLGAIVEVTDVRPETKEQVESLGGRFLEVAADAGVSTQGGYATQVSDDYLQRQQALVRQRIAEADLVITTALVLGKKAPMLIPADMVASMKQGSVIVDMAVEAGGNCALSQANQIVVEHGVTIIGECNLPALLAVNASELYARNIAEILKHLANKDGFVWNNDDEITRACLITHGGNIVQDFTRKQLQVS